MNIDYYRLEETSIWHLDGLYDINITFLYNDRLSVKVVMSVNRLNAAQGEWETFS